MTERELEHDITDMLTSRSLAHNAWMVSTRRPTLTVGELIDILSRFDPGEEVFVLDSCGCCTGFENLEAACVGERDVGMDDRFGRDKSTAELIDDHEANPRLAPLPLPRSQWLRRGVVLAGAGWVYYPEVDAAAAQRIAEMPGARHIDEALIEELKAARATKAKEAEDAGQGPDCETE